MNEEVNANQVNQNIEKDEKYTRRMNKETALRKKIKICNEEALVLKLEKGNNLRIFCSTTAFEGMKEIVESTVRKSNKVKDLRNEDYKRGVYSESMSQRKGIKKNSHSIYS